MFIYGSGLVLIKILACEWKKKRVVLKHEEIYDICSLLNLQCKFFKGDFSQTTVNESNKFQQVSLFGPFTKGLKFFLCIKIWFYRYTQSGKRKLRIIVYLLHNVAVSSLKFIVNIKQFS